MKVAAAPLFAVPYLAEAAVDDAGLAVPLPVRARVRVSVEGFHQRNYNALTKITQLRWYRHVGRPVDPRFVAS